MGPTAGASVASVASVLSPPTHPRPGARLCVQQAPTQLSLPSSVSGSVTPKSSEPQGSKLQPFLWAYSVAGSLCGWSRALGQAAPGPPAPGTSYPGPASLPQRAASLGAPGGLSSWTLQLHLPLSPGLAAV